jgi:hypothetical protein
VEPRSFGRSDRPSWDKSFIRRSRFLLPGECEDEQSNQDKRDCHERVENPRLAAVRVVLFPAATGCYKVLSFLQFISSSSESFAIRTPQIMLYFEGEWAQKWAQSNVVNPSV